MPATDLRLDVLMDELLLVLLLPLPEVPRRLLHVALALQCLLVGGVDGGRGRRHAVPGSLQLALALAVAQDGARLGCAQALRVLVGLAQRGRAHVARVVVAASLLKEGKVSTFTTLGSSLSLSLSSFGRHSELKAQKSSKNDIYDIHSLDLVFVFAPVDQMASCY